jgi:outer membrane protein TolC
LRRLVQVATADYQVGKTPFERVHQATRALFQARLDMCESEKERITLLEEAVAQAKNYEKHAEQRYKAGVAPQSDALTATAARLEAEIALERAKSRAGAMRPK